MIGIIGDIAPCAIEFLEGKGIAHSRFPEVPVSAKERDQITGLIIRSTHKIGEDELIALPNLKVVVTATSGHDHIDLNRCEAHFVKAYHTPLAAVDSVAELTLMLAISVLRNLTNIHLSVKSTGLIQRPLLDRGRTLKESTWGIVGFGRIGKRVTELVRPLAKQVFIYDPYVDQADMDFSQFIKQVDIVSLHIPLFSETRNMISEKTFMQMKNTAILINVARGEVVDQQALIDAIEEGQIAGAGLDVFAAEPLPANSPLLKYKNVVLTPHVGAYTGHSLTAASAQAAETIVDFLAGRPTDFQLPESAAWCANRVI